jgi:hypothetical protein
MYPYELSIKTSFRENLIRMLNWFSNNSYWKIP